MTNVRMLIFGLTIALIVVAAAQEHFGWASFLLILALSQSVGGTNAPRPK